MLFSCPVYLLNFPFQKGYFWDMALREEDIASDMHILFPPVVLLSLAGKWVKWEALTGRKCMGIAEYTFRKQKRTGWDQGSSPGEYPSISIIGHFYKPKKYCYV